MAFMPPQGPQGPQQGPLSPPPTTIPNNLWPVPLPLTRERSQDVCFASPIYGRDLGLASGFPTFVGRTSVAGFRWTGRRWVFSGFDLRRIESFTCY